MSKSQENNPQLAVVQAILNDFERMRGDMKKALGGFPNDPKKKLDKDVLIEMLTQLRERHEATLQILTRDNYYRVINPELVDIWGELPQMVSDAVEDKDFQQALELSLIWEKIMLRIFRECYPNMKEAYRELLDAVARMRIVPLPGRMGSFGFDSEIPQDYNFENVPK